MMREPDIERWTARQKGAVIKQIYRGGPPCLRLRATTTSPAELLHVILDGRQGVLVPFRDTDFALRR